MQEGIFYQQGTKPGTHWGLLFLRVKSSADNEIIYEALKQIWRVFNELKKGNISDLPGTNLPVPPNGLNVTIGYGKNIFSRPGIKKLMPLDFSQSNFRSPLPTGGGKLLLGAGLSYADAITKNPATEDIAFQFISDSELLVYRAYMEAYKFISRHNTVDTFPFELVKFYNGFQREDSRSWIDFHDGISNLRSGDERFDAIAIKDNNTPGEDWVANGTYLAFMRIEVDIDKWIAIDNSVQEMVVGRNKLTGCPINTIQGNTTVVANGCPFAGTSTIVDQDANGNYLNSAFFETPVTADQRVLQSHVQRANHHRTPINQKDSLRIFRQGYEFFESSDSNPKVKVGLNFVSFQDTPERLIRILNQESWLGNINFGGSETDEINEARKFLKIWAAGIYLIPPVNDESKIPGYELFE